MSVQALLLAQVPSLIKAMGFDAEVAQKQMLDVIARVENMEASQLRTEQMVRELYTRSGVATALNDQAMVKAVEAISAAQANVQTPNEEGVS